MLQVHITARVRAHAWRGCRPPPRLQRRGLTVQGACGRNRAAWMAIVLTKRGSDDEKRLHGAAAPVLLDHVSIMATNCGDELRPRSVQISRLA